MMLFRPQRRTLADAMAECREFDGTWVGLQAILNDGVSADAWNHQTLVSVEPYRYDSRIGWDTHIVLTVMPQSKQASPAGFTNGPVER